MQRVDLGDFQLEYEEVGAGEPVLLIHGGFVDTFFPKPAELSLAKGYRVIAYHRRGYSGSTQSVAPFSIAQQAEDARTLLRHLDVAHTHLAGHSYGGVIALELARQTPDLVGSLALLEPGLAAAAPSGPAFLEFLGDIEAIYAEGDREGAVDTFCTAVVGSDYRELLAKVLHPEALEQIISDCHTPFEVELDALRQWSFTAEDAGRIQQPVLSVLGEDSFEIAGEIDAVVREWFPQAESLVVPDANHTLPYMNPHAVSDGMRAFLGRHPL